MRSLWDEEEEQWYFSIVDVVEILTESPNARNYWKVLKHRLIKEGNQLVTNCNQLKMESSEGKFYKTLLFEGYVLQSFAFLFGTMNLKKQFHNFRIIWEFVLIFLPFFPILHLQINYTMKNLLIIIAFITMFGCNESSKPNTNISEKEEVAYIEHTFVKTDTLHFASDSSRMVVVGLQETVMYSDSSKHVPMDVMYYVNGKRISIYMDSLIAEGEGEELYLSFEGMDANEVSCEHFFSVNYGFPACGYTQQHITFYPSQTSLDIVAKHTSAADGMYGGGCKFYNMCLVQSANQITSVEESREPIDDKEEHVLVSYSDSTVYFYSNNVWTSKMVTEKGKVFRTDKEKM